MDESHITGLVEELRKSGKYRDLCDDTLRRIACWAGKRHPRRKEAVKAAKRKLHQVYGAYAQHLDMAAIDSAIDSMSGASKSDVRQACLDILGRHASTTERIPALRETYERLFAETGTPDTVLDLACGLNPFALPWMDLPRSTRYVAVDIDRRLAVAITRFFVAVGQNGEAVCGDLLVAPPEVDADLVLLLKALPCLEQQEKGASEQLLCALKARRTVVSFPARSLGGKNKGMAEHYAQFMQGLTTGLDRDVRTWTTHDEIFYLWGPTP